MEGQGARLSTSFGRRQKQSRGRRTNRYCVPRVRLQFAQEWRSPKLGTGDYELQMFSRNHRRIETVLGGHATITGGTRLACRGIKSCSPEPARRSDEAVIPGNRFTVAAEVALPPGTHVYAPDVLNLSALKGRRFSGYACARKRPTLTPEGSHRAYLL